MRARDVAWGVAGAWAGGAVGTFLTLVLDGSDLAFWPWAVFVPAWWPLLLVGFEVVDLDAWWRTFVGAGAGLAAAAAWRSRRGR